MRYIRLMILISKLKRINNMSKYWFKSLSKTNSIKTFLINTKSFKVNGEIWSYTSED